jgi:hypothetical protein
MAAQEKQALLQQMDETRAKILSSLQAIEHQAIIYTEGGWKLTDVINHMMVWEEISLVSLQAFREGKEGPVVEEPIFNAQTVAERRHWSVEAIFAAWQSARDQFKAAIVAIPEEQWHSQFLFPWGEQGDVAKMVSGLLWHENEHLQDVLKVTRKNDEG